MSDNEAVLRQIAEMPDERNEWDAVERYEEARNLARAAVGLPPLYPDEPDEEAARLAAFQAARTAQLQREDS